MQRQEGICSAVLAGSKKAGFIASALFSPTQFSHWEWKRERKETTSKLHLEGGGDLQGRRVNGAVWESPSIAAKAVLEGSACAL